MRKYQLWLSLWLSLAAMPLAATGNAAEAERRIQLNASANLQLANDVMEVTLGASAEHKQAALAAKQVNEASNWALQIIKQHPELKVSTSSYRSYPLYDDGKLKNWRVDQVLLLKSGNFALLSTVLGKLQQRLAIQNSQFRPSKAARAAAQDELLRAALKDFQHRAKVVQTSLGAKAYKIIKIDIHNSGNAMPIMYARHNSMQKREVAIEAGDSELQLSLSATIELQD